MYNTNVWANLNIKAFTECKLELSSENNFIDW